MIYNTFQKTREQKDFIIITTYIYIYIIFKRRTPMQVQRQTNTIFNSKKNIHSIKVLIKFVFTSVKEERLIFASIFFV